MVLPPRQLLFRLVFWIAIFAWAIWKIGDLGTGSLAVPELLAPPVPEPAGPVAVPAPAARPTPEGEAPTVVDPAVAVAVMDEAVRAAAACHATGTLGVRLGPEGLAEAWVPAGTAPEVVTCLAGPLWALAWPRTTMGFEMEREIAP